MTDGADVRPRRAVRAHAIGAGIVGGLAAPVIVGFVWWGLLIGGWAGSSDGAFYELIALGVAAGAVLALAGIEAATSQQPARWPGRLVRAGALLVLGFVVWLPAGAFAVLNESISFVPPLALVLGPVPFALIAVHQHGRPTSTRANLLVVLLLGGGLLVAVAALYQSSYQSARNERLEQVAEARDLAYMLDIPGYRVTSGSGLPGPTVDNATFNALDLPDEQYGDELTISVITQRAAFDCDIAVLSGREAADNDPVCELESPGLWYLSSPTPTFYGEGCRCGQQGYARQDGGTVVQVSASGAVPRELLRDAVNSARRATEDELRRRVDGG